MASNKFETELLIKAGVKGLESIAKLGKEIEAAGIDVSKLSAEGQKLNKTFNDIESQNTLINQFKAQKQAVADASKAWQDAQEQTKKLAQQWQDASNKADALKQAIDEQGKATKAQKAEYQQAVKDVTRLAKAQADSAKNAKSIKQQYTELNSTLSNTRKAMNDAGISTKNLAKHQQQLKTDSDKAEQALAELNSEAQQLSEVAKAKVTLGIDTDDKARKQLLETTKAYETLKNSGKLTSDELAHANAAHTQKVKELEAQLGKTAPTLSQLTQDMGKFTAAAGGIAYVTKEAMSFEAAMTGVTKTLNGATNGQIKALSSEIKKLSVDLGLSSEAVANIAAEGGRLGVPIEQIGKFTEMAGKMAISFDMTAEQAAKSAAQLANVFSVPLSDVEALGDAINTLGNNMAATESDIVQSTLRIGGTTKTFGLVEEQAAALAATFISLGKSPEVAATAVNALLTKLQTAEGQTDEFKNALDSIGMSAEQLAVNINSNPQQALNDFLSTLAKLDKQQQAMVTSKLFGAEYADDISLLTGSLDTYDKAIGLVADKTATAGAMQDEFNAQMSNSTKDVDKAKAQLAALASTLGDALLPVVSATAQGVTGIAGAINSVAEQYPALTQLAVIMATGKLAVMAYNTTMSAAGAIGIKSGAQIAKGYLGGKSAIDAATLSAAKFNKVAGGSSSVMGGVASQASKATGGLKGMASEMTNLNNLFALAASWEIGKSVGNWLYENVAPARTFGDELGRLLAYADAIVTDRTFEDVAKHFETSAEAEARLAKEANNTTQKMDEQAVSAQKASDEAKKQAAANIQLANNIIITQANVTKLKNELAELERNGKANSTEFEQLSLELENTQTKLNQLNAEASAAGIGDMLKTEIDKASQAFQDLGLDAGEFATGLNSQTTKALDAFVTIARIADKDINKLARAYNAAKEAAGNNAEAQNLLQQNLLQVVQGNNELADSVKRTALEQQNAKSATDAQAQALDKLGISMQAVNQNMSASGLEMVATLKAGVTAIKAQATSADALKTALTQALDTSIAAAQTKADFAAINDVIQQAGVSGQITAQHIKKIQTGMAGGADAVNKATQAIADNAKALADNAKTASANTVATKANADAKKAQADAANKAADAESTAEQASASASQTYTALTPSFVASVTQRIDSLKQFGATTEQIATLTNKFYSDLEYRSNNTFDSMITTADGLSKSLDTQIKQFNDTRDAVTKMSAKLADASVTTDDLADAQSLLAQATTISIGGMVKLDKQTLAGLQASIDSARAKLQGLADDAKNTADNLEATLAKLRGDDDKARAIEQSKKLLAIEHKLADAKARNNADEVKQLERALRLQREINREETKQARAQQAQQVQQQRKQQINLNTTTYSSSSQVDTAGIADTVQDLIAQAEQRAAQNVVKQLKNDLKTRAR